jgi:hypothetical protein
MNAQPRARLLLAAVVLCGSAHAIEPIPAEPGWSGFVTVGVGGVSAETNMVAGIDRYGVDVGNATISSLANKPDSKSAAIPQVNLNINYTFSTQTQLFLGNSLENVVQFDTAAVFGVRQQFADRSILELSMVSTPFISPVQVWRDPYVVGAARQETDRTSRGPRIEYDRILGSGFGVRYTQRKTELDEEESGTTQLGLPAAQAALLSREGDTKHAQVSYRFPRAGRHIVELRLGLQKEDLDGQAMSGDQHELQLTHVYLGDRFTVASNLFLAKQDYDAVNPVFNRTREDESWGVGFIVFDKRISNSKSWFGQATLVYHKQSSNIDFYEASSTIAAVGAQYRF